MSKNRNWHAVDAQFRNSAGPMKSDKDYRREKREKRMNMRKRYDQGYEDYVYDEEILDPEAEEELRQLLESEDHTVSGIENGREEV